MSGFAKKIRKVVAGSLLTGATLFATAPTDGCQQAANAFVQGFEYGYDHPEVLDEILGSTTMLSASEASCWD